MIQSPNLYWVSIMCRRNFKNNYKSEIKSNVKDMSIFLFLCVEGASGHEIGDEGCFASGHITPSKVCNICPYSPRKAPDEVTFGLKLKGKKEPRGEDLCREGEEKVRVLRWDQTCERRFGGRGVQGSGAGGKAYERDLRERMDKGTLPLLLTAPSSEPQTVLGTREEFNKALVSGQVNWEAHNSYRHSTPF